MSASGDQNEQGKQTKVLRQAVTSSGKLVPVE